MDIEQSDKLHEIETKLLNKQISQMTVFSQLHHKIILDLTKSLDVSFDKINSAQKKMNRNLTLNFYLNVVFLIYILWSVYERRN